MTKLITKCGDKIDVNVYFRFHPFIKCLILKVNLIHSVLDEWGRDLKFTYPIIQ